MRTKKSPTKLRDYQLRTIELCRKAYKDGHRRTLVALPTGSGKTEIFIEQTRSALSKGKRVLIVVRRKSIVLQTAKRLAAALDTQVGVYMSNHTHSQQSSCVVSSIDTLSLRFKNSLVKEWALKFDVIIVDEAHDATSDSYEKVLSYLADVGKKTIIGYTATPYRIGKKGHTWWSCCIKPVTAAQLRDKGYLAPLTIYSPANMDTSNIKIMRGEFHNSDLYQAVNQKKIYGNIIKTYKRLAEGKSAIVFCVNKEHSRRVSQAFIEAGYDSEHSDCGTSAEERKRVLDYVGRARGQGKPFILCNVNIFSTGIDIPSVGVIIQARPTASKVLYIQQVGRVLRTFNGKEHALLIDHGGNASRFGSPYDDHEPELNDIERYNKSEVMRQVGHRCQSCGYYASVKPEVCPGCGKNHAEDAIIPKETEEPLELYSCDRINKLKKELYFVREALLNKGKSIDYAYYVMHKKHGASILNYLPDLDCPDVIRRIIEKRQLQMDRGKGEAKKVQQKVQTQFYS